MEGLYRSGCVWWCICAACVPSHAFAACGEAVVGGNMLGCTSCSVSLLVHFISIVEVHRSCFAYAAFGQWDLFPYDTRGSDILLHAILSTKAGLELGQCGQLNRNE